MTLHFVVVNVFVVFILLLAGILDVAYFIYSLDEIDIHSLNVESNTELLKFLIYFYFYSFFNMLGFNPNQSIQLLFAVDTFNTFSTHPFFFLQCFTALDSIFFLPRFYLLILQKSFEFIYCFVEPIQLIYHHILYPCLVILGQYLDYFLFFLKNSVALPLLKFFQKTFFFFFLCILLQMLLVYFFTNM